VTNEEGSELLGKVVMDGGEARGAAEEEAAIAAVAEVGLGRAPSALLSWHRPVSQPATASR
jgi:hypothetical protein